MGMEAVLVYWLTGPSESNAAVTNSTSSMTRTTQRRLGSDCCLWSEEKSHLSGSSEGEMGESLGAPGTEGSRDAVANLNIWQLRRRLHSALHYRLLT